MENLSIGKTKVCKLDLVTGSSPIVLFHQSLVFGVVDIGISIVDKVIDPLADAVLGKPVRLVLE